MTPHAAATPSYARSEQAWFDGFDPELYEEDGSHWFSGLPRRMETLPPPPQRANFHWVRFVLLSLAAIAVGITVAIGLIG